MDLSRTAMLLGKPALERLASSRVAVFGLGGVGGYALEALVRSGVGQLDLFDGDVVSASNLNRQLLATVDAIGRPKTEVAKERVNAINPDCVVTTHRAFLMPDDVAALDLSVYNYVVDAIDTVSTKLALAVRCHEQGVPLISCMGTGNKLDAGALEVADIAKTSVCPLARVMRRELKARGIDHLKVVFSKEQPLSPIVSEDAETKGTSGRIAPGSVSFVPSVAGLLMAGEVVRDLIKE